MYRRRSDFPPNRPRPVARQRMRLVAVAATAIVMAVASLTTAGTALASGAPGAASVIVPLATTLRAPVVLQGAVAPAANIRSGPSTRYRVVGTLKKGAKVTGRLDPATGWYWLAAGRYISKTVVGTVPIPKVAAPKAPAAKPATPQASTPKSPAAKPPTVPVSPSAPAPKPPATPPIPGGFDAGNLIADTVFYNTTAMTEAQVRAFIATKNSSCTGPLCLRSLKVDAPSRPANAYCAAYPGGPGKDAASVIAALAVACGLNPQVMLVILQQESGLLTKTAPTAAAYQAAWGWACPGVDTAGAAACAPADRSGFFNQAYGMARQFASYRIEPAKYPYRAGQTATIAYSPSAACGRAPVRMANAATASLYNYTPYQPNPASLSGYPGTGDTCSSYGIRNFYFLFSNYFGSTGGGTGGTPVVASGASVTIPASPFVSNAMAGQTITAPNPAVARGIAAGLTALGTPYVWGGGTNGGPSDQGCSRGAGQNNSCRGVSGFDCSGLTAYVLRQAGFAIPGNSSAQRAGGTAVPWAQAWPGDIVGYPGHVAIYLGTIGSTRYILEAPHEGAFVRVVGVAQSGREPADTSVHRYWQ